MEKRCSVCGGKHEALGLCKKHYDAQKHLKNRAKNLARMAKFNADNPDYRKKWAAANRDKLRAAAKRWRDKDKEHARKLERANHQRNKKKRNEASRQYAEKNREKVRELARNWARRNRAKHVISVQGRRAAKYKALLSWADKDLIADIYHLAHAYRLAGVACHVDHIVPLRSKLVCGLHVPANLRLMSAAANQRKGNREWPDMPQDLDLVSSSAKEYHLRVAGTASAPPARDRLQQGPGFVGRRPSTETPRQT